MTHTPAPWEFVKNDVSDPANKGRLGSIMHDQWFIAEVYRDVPGAGANAKIIAAAPTLIAATSDSYEMLTMLMKRLDYSKSPLNMNNEGDKKLWDKFLEVQIQNEAAIKKATT
jgi:hypothetical protein